MERGLSAGTVKAKLPGTTVVMAALVVTAALVATLVLSSCAAPGGDPLVRHTTAVAGRPRVWYEYRPPGLASGPAPLVVMLHGFGMTATAMVGLTGIDAAARRDGFTVAFPQGLEKSWNAGGCCGAAAVAQVDDVAMLAAVIQGQVASGAAQAARVYVVGFSNGAMMAYRFACERSDLIAGAAVVEGTLTSACPPHRSVDLLVIHQRDDLIVPLAGNPNPHAAPWVLAPLPPVVESLNAWLAAGGCASRVPPAAGLAPAPPAVVAPIVRVSAPCLPAGRATVDLLSGGAHYWPKVPAAPLSATDEIVAYFSLKNA